MAARCGEEGRVELVNHVCSLEGRISPPARGSLSRSLPPVRVLWRSEAAMVCALLLVEGLDLEENVVVLVDWKRVGAS